ncbi:MAG TPA: UDP-N-acetylmuramoyl-tripeptide--D-alanyl-D-alanine ligase [Solirubrobacterales bacterium]|nr:UDP-N-acetylmuramoyl-tripeptide--D-alanyl-D-alanine ligase [Solirubrobacterales bacterium]
MIGLAPEAIAGSFGGEIAARGQAGEPRRAVIDSREAAAGDLFFGLRGERADGGEHAAAALAAGAWGAVVDSDRAASLAAEGHRGWVFAAPDPLLALQRTARAVRRALGCPVVGITGSTGKTSVKDITAALLPGRVHASPENFNTEIGLPLTVCAAPADTDVLVLEMAMRGLGQIAELCEIAEPDVAAITNVGPVHLELLGTVEAIAEAKAEIVAGLGADGLAVVPADAEALEPHLADELRTITFGDGGHVFARASAPAGDGLRAEIVTPGGAAEFEFPFDQAHNLVNATCAVAIGTALGVPVGEMARRAPGISFSRLRGEVVRLPAGSVLINDCYNANPISMQAALDHLASLAPSGNAIAVLGGMAELGPDGPEYHRSAAAHARELGIGPIVGVGELARDYSPDEWASDPDAAVDLVAGLLGDGDAVLVKGSRSVGLERFTEGLRARVGEG